MELRAELLHRGHQFATRSDTEVMIHLYEEYGDDFVERLQGMFAVALWDEQRERLVLARDRLGIKPLFWTIHDGALVFGSEIKVLVDGCAPSCRSGRAARLPVVRLCAGPTHDVRGHS